MLLTEPDFAVIAQHEKGFLLLQAARDLHKLGPEFVLIKGGHLMAPPSAPPATASDPQEPPPNSTTTFAAPQDQSNAPGGSEVEQSQQQTDSQQHPASQKAVLRDPHETRSHDAESSQQQTPGATLTEHQQHPTSADAEEAGQQDRHSDACAQEATFTLVDGAEASDKHQAQADASSTHGVVAPAQQQPPKGDPAEKHESSAGAVDVLFDGEEILVLESRRVHTNNTHGTGTSLVVSCSAFNLNQRPQRGTLCGGGIIHMSLLNYSAGCQSLWLYRFLGLSSM